MLFDITSPLSRDVASFSQVQQILLTPSNSSYPAHSIAAFALRKVLRENLSPAYRVSQGYLCTENQAPIFQEVIIFDREQKTILEEGNIVYLKPEHARVVVGVADERQSEMQIQEWLKTSSEIEHYMHQANNAQGLVVYWVESARFGTRYAGFHSWKNGMAERKIPALVAWGESNVFCRHIGWEPKLYKWQPSYERSSEASPALTSLLSLIWYHLLERNKVSPFRQWFPENCWKEEQVTEQIEAPLNGSKTSINSAKENSTNHSSSNGQQKAQSKPNRSSSNQKKQRKARLKNKRRRKGSKASPSHPSIPIPTADMSNNPVHFAVLSLDLDALNRCIDQGIDINEKNKEGNSPIHLAALYDLVEVAEVLIDAGADLNSRNYVYATPLHMAIEKGNNEFVELLLEVGAEVEARNNRARTPLHQAAMFGNKDAAILLLDNFADIHATMEKDMQPLHVASWYGQSEIVDLLIEKEANMNAINSDGNTALHFAAFNGQVKVIKQLINYHADPSIPNNSGETYLQVINEGYSGEVIRVLE